MSHSPAPTGTTPAEADLLSASVGTEKLALPLAWPEAPSKPEAVPVRVWPQTHFLAMANQPFAFRAFGINE